MGARRVPPCGDDAHVHQHQHCQQVWFCPSAPEPLSIDPSFRRQHLPADRMHLVWREQRQRNGPDVLHVCTAQLSVAVPVRRHQRHFAVSRQGLRAAPLVKPGFHQRASNCQLQTSTCPALPLYSTLVAQVGPGLDGVPTSSLDLLRHEPTVPTVPAQPSPFSPLPQPLPGSPPISCGQCAARLRRL